MKLFTFKNTLIIALFLILILLIAYRFSLNRQVPPPIPKQPIPGQSSIPAVLTITPFLIQTYNGQTDYYVGQPQSSNYTQYVGNGQGKLSYYIDNDPKSFAHRDLDGYIKQYGQPNFQLYGPWFVESGYLSYVFLKPGLVVVAHPVSKYVTQVWHVPQNLSSDNFSAQFGDTFKTTPPPRNTQM